MTEINRIKKEYDELLKQLSDPELISDWERFEKLSNKKKELEKIIERQKEIDEIRKQTEENKEILRTGEDSELAALAETDNIQLQEKEKTLQKELENLLNLFNSDAEDIANLSQPLKIFDSVIVEIRAGTGGEEAALFAGDLFRMYQKYAVSQGWQQKILDSHPSELAGFKEIIFELKGHNVYNKLKNEGGVHRVQRTPKTEKSGRIHTSTATVVILPKPKSAEIKIKADEIKIDVFRSSGPGGQNVNKRETAVRITHLPTGIIVTSQTERNQPRNKENALSILAARLLEKKTEEEQTKIAGKRKAQAGWAKRVEKIRTYNFPQSRVTDHRIKKSWHNLEKILDGELDEIVETVRKRIKN